MADILHQVGIQASQDALYSALTEQAGLQSWWSEHSVIEPSAGSMARISFYNNAVVFEFRVEELVPGESVVWKIVGGPPDWVDTTITWNLSPEEGQTILDFAHRGFASTEGNFASVNYNWGWYITSLKFLLEKRKGMPHTDADLI